VAAAVLICALPACKPEPISLRRDSGAEGPIQVFLPPTPDLNRPRAPIHLPDGAYTVRGIVDSGGSLLNRIVTVRGLVSEIRSCREEDERLCALPTHAILVDSLAEPTHRLIAVGSRLKTVAGIEPGTRVELSGRVDTVSLDGRIVSLDGLLVLPAPDEESTATEDTEAEQKAKRRRPRRVRRRAPKLDLSVP
jgi:hypothetical protein